MKKVTKKALGILALAVLSVPAQAGWLSNLGQRIVNGAANTVQTNISGKVNKAVNDVMDGKVGNQKNNSNTGYNKDTSSEAIQNTGAPTSVSNKSKTNTIKNQEKLEPVSYKGATGMVIPSTGKYELIDLRITKFTGEEIYSNPLKIRKKLRGPKQIEMILGRDEIQYIVEVLPNTKGHLELALINNQKLSGSGWISIFKIPGPELK